MKHNCTNIDEKNEYLSNEICSVTEQRNMAGAKHNDLSTNSADAGGQKWDCQKSATILHGKNSSEKQHTLVLFTNEHEHE